MKNTYIKTTWVNNKTPINAANLNKIESAIYDIYNSALGINDIKPGEGINVVPDNGLDGKVRIETSKDVMKSQSTCGIEVLNSEPSEMIPGKLYFINDPNTGKLEKIMFNNLVIYEVAK